MRARGDSCFSGYVLLCGVGGVKEKVGATGGVTIGGAEVTWQSISADPPGERYKHSHATP